MKAVKSEQNSVRLKPIQGRIRIEQFLQILTVVILVSRYPQATAKAADTNGRQQVAQCARAEDREADRLGCPPFRWAIKKPAADYYIEGVGPDEIKPRIGKRDGGVPGAIPHRLKSLEFTSPIRVRW